MEYRDDGEEEDDDAADFDGSDDSTFLESIAANGGLVLDARCLYLVTQSARMIAAEIKNNHFLTTLDLSHNPIELEGYQFIADVIRENVVLKAVYMPELTIAENREAAATLLRQAKYESFCFRVSLAVFVRGMEFLDLLPLHEILEFLIAPGPQIPRFLAYRR